MSLYGSLFTGVSALNAQSQNMSIISNNIANVNTIGYKRSEGFFETLVTGSNNPSGIAPGGVRANQRATNNQQGLAQQSNSSTDIAVAGNGFFPVVQQVSTTATGIQTSETLYTRNGSFTEDSRGFLRNTSGNFLLGWPLDGAGNLPPAPESITSLEPIDVAFAGGLTRPTENAELVFNLDARQDSAVAGPHFTRALRVYDSLGVAQDLSVEITRTAPSPALDWEMVIRDPGGVALSTTALQFDGNGRLTTPAPNANGDVIVTVAGINFGNGSTAQDIDFDITDFTQFAGDYNVVFVDQDGAELGNRTGVSIDREGFVVASFSNGQTERIYKLPLTTFANVNGLEALTGNVFRETTDSGGFNLREPGQGGAGFITPSALEAANVDLADEFSRMIITQRAYSAGTKVITTADQMLEELLRIR